MSDETVAQAELLAAKAETRADPPRAALPADFLETFAKDHELRSAAIFLPGSKTPRGFLGSLGGESPPTA